MSVVRDGQGRPVTCAYRDAQDSFEARREAVVDAAVDAHDRGDDAEAQRLMEKARAMRFTGLWSDVEPVA